MTIPTYSLDSIQTEPEPILDKCRSRLPCPQCGKVVKYFCYRCYLVVGVDPERIPRLTLPVKLQIYKHHLERDGKSTAVHAKIIAPDDVTIHTYPNVPLNLENIERSVLLFPGPDAKTLEEIDPNSFDQIIVIDGTWRQAQAMVKYTEGLDRVQKVTIQPRATRFWRYQQFSDNHLATIEAIYFFYREYYDAYLRFKSSSGTQPNKYSGQYDDLMFYYKYFYNLIQRTYQANPTKLYNRRQRTGYIKYDPTDNSDTLSSTEKRD
ncbi:hypothetical protein IWQ62_002837 [Dispira parvispora]|uniref:tRNA-uridine aminocarboxypropyltransferase 1 n=1 Tax=Dispira parvispora TaxID=1520584 RepID=A0A9W8E7L5_9FUNG|nr:hypothetical protein IWQ62_002837 [Dispira parvispora]